MRVDDLAERSASESSPDTGGDCGYDGKKKRKTIKPKKEKKVVPTSKLLQRMLDEHLSENKVVTFLGPEDYLRASTIYKVCPRAEVLRIKSGLITSERIPGKLRRTYNFGRAFEEVIRSEFGSAGVLSGEWICRDCGGLRVGLLGACNKCGSAEMKFRERFVHNRKLYLGGHVDGELQYGRERFVLEIKTVAEYFWKEVRFAPLPQHEAQVQVYLHLLQMDKALVWYFNKNSSDWRVHEVAYSEEAVQPWVQKGLQMRLFFDHGRVPRRICGSPADKLAQKCALARLCFPG